MEHAAIRFKPAVPADFDVISRLHAESWCRLYAAVLPAAVLGPDLETKLGRHWCRVLEAKNPSFVEVAIVKARGQQMTVLGARVPSTELGFDI